MNAGVAGDGFVVADQSSDVNNFGWASTDTGSNIAYGNVSNNTASTTQSNGGVTADSVFGNASLTASDIAISNNAETSNTSEGVAHITTGAASATGTTSDDWVAQEVNGGISGNGFVMADQASQLHNSGYATADTGDNTAYGNGSTNNADTDQRARVRASSVFGSASVAADDIAVANTASTSNISNGFAGMTTGDAQAVGNDSTADVTQAVNGGIGGDGFVTADQHNTVVNYGTAHADSGDNTATGNLSHNYADTFQRGTVRAMSGEGNASVDAMKVALANTATTANESDGYAEITTGCADATGNSSATAVTQFVNGGISGDGFVMSHQDSFVVNDGAAHADTGDNRATGNASTNDADTDQRARLRAYSVFGPARVIAGDVALTNMGDTTN
ncbi:MAG: hypothetical protein LC708_03715, partial [Actinobacteria bacterium]|nr:hypothetical protein [Actinomycetota bacterium]